MAKGKNQDFFSQTKGFLTAFQQVLDEGFFESMAVEVRGLENLGATHVSIRAEAFLPSSKKDMAPGVTSFVDPMTVIEAIRHQLRTSKFVLQSRTCEVKTEDWHKIGKGDVFIGKRGLKLSFNFAVYMMPESWIEKP